MFQKLKNQISFQTLMAISIFLLAFWIYHQRAAPSVATIFDDSLEFPLVVHRLAIAHPTGYPLYTLLGKGFSLFNPHNVAYQLNVMSAFFAAVSVALLYRLGFLAQAQNLSFWARHSGALLGSVFLGCGVVFSSQATLAEVYSLNAFFVILLLYLALDKRWLWLALATGFALTHHRTIVLLLPGLVLYALSDPDFRQKFWRRFPAYLGLSLLPLLLYLYLPWRGEIGALDGSYQPSWSGFWQHIMGGGYSSFLLENPLGEARNLNFYIQLFVAELGGWGLVLALLGLGRLFYQKAWSVLSLSGLSFSLYLIFNLFYQVSDIDVFFIPLFVLTAFWAGLAWSQFLQYFRQGAWWSSLLLSGLLIALIWQSATLIDRSEDWQIHFYGLDMLNAAEENAQVIGILGEMTLLQYMQAMTGQKPKLQTFPADRDEARLALISQSLQANPQQPLYTTRELAGLPERFSLSAAGPLIQVHAQAQLEPPVVAQVLDQALSPQLRAYGYHWEAYPHSPTERAIRLVIVWQTLEAMSADLKVSARLLDQAGNVAAVVDKVPVHFAYLTTYWRPGEFVTDNYAWQIPQDAPLGPYQPLLIWYDPAQNGAEIGRVTLPELWFAE